MWPGRSGRATCGGWGGVCVCVCVVVGVVVGGPLPQSLFSLADMIKLPPLYTCKAWMIFRVLGCECSSLRASKGRQAAGGSRLTQQRGVAACQCPATRPLRPAAAAAGSSQPVRRKSQKSLPTEAAAAGQEREHG